ncbi:hypothetical protein B0H12DRAFT_691752 [Mycena haematopus]|nr:hypothetical protein B0H12DRAFT_691752 [Mycena haematopus]
MVVIFGYTYCSDVESRAPYPSPFFDLAKNVLWPTVETPVKDNPSLSFAVKHFQPPVLRRRDPPPQVLHTTPSRALETIPRLLFNHYLTKYRRRPVALLRRRRALSTPILRRREPSPLRRRRRPKIVPSEPPLRSLPMVLMNSATPASKPVAPHRRQALSTPVLPPPVLRRHRRPEIMPAEPPLRCLPMMLVNSATPASKPAAPLRRQALPTPVLRRRDPPPPMLRRADYR